MRFCIVAILCASFLVLPAHASVKSPVTIADAISMVRIQRTYTSAEQVAAFSPNGSHFASVVWHGDLLENKDIFELMIFDRNSWGGWKKPRTILFIPFAGDPHDQHATPIAELQFLPDNRTVAFLGTLHGEPRQVFSVDIQSGRLRQLTHHTTEIAAYGAGADGRSLLFAALSPASNSLASAYRRGFSIPQRASPNEGWGGELDSLQYALNAVLSDRTVQYYYVAANGRERLLYDTAHNPSRYQQSADGVRSIYGLVSVSPSGRFAVIAPYNPSSRPLNLQAYKYFPRATPGMAASTQNQLTMASSFGLADLQTGTVRRLLDAPSIPYGTIGSVNVLWSPDSQSVIVPSFLPLNSTDPNENSRRAAMMQQPYVEVNVATNALSLLDVPADWALRGRNSNALVFLRTGYMRFPDSHAIALLKKGNGAWESFQALPAQDSPDLNPRYATSVFANILVGVRDNLMVPPNLASYSLTTHRTTVLSDLNPQLRHRIFAPVTRIRWDDQYDKGTNFGYLIKPLGYVPGKRYPLAYLLKDEGYYPGDNSFIIDGQEQLNAFAAQTLASEGFVVLLSPDPYSVSKVTSSPAEMIQMQAHVESGVHHLDQLGLIDPAKVAISGWSRAAYYTDYLIAHSNIRFAAASDEDGGGNYDLFMRKDGGASKSEWLVNDLVDLRLRDIHTPLLSEEHGPGSLDLQSRLIARLQDMHKPVDLYYFPDEPHTLLQPVHRYTSLSVHTDWFRFWLQDYEDPNPAKAAQYRFWRSLRALNR